VSINFVAFVAAEGFAKILRAFERVKVNVSKKKFKLILAVSIILAASARGFAFTGDGCGEGECKDCHYLSVDDATKIMEGLVDKVVSVEHSEVPGLWKLEVIKDGRKIPVNIDYSEQYLIPQTLSIAELKKRMGMTHSHKSPKRERMVDASKVTLKGALVLGNPKAEKKLIVFDDPECPHCQRLHNEIKKVVAKRDDLVFYIKMLPLEMHKDARRKAKTIICQNSVELLEASFNKKAVPDPECQTDVIEKTEAEAASLGIHSTPTVIFPNGLLSPGYKPAEKLIAYIDNPPNVDEEQKEQKEQANKSQ